MSEDDHVIALIIDGGTYHRDIVNFVEDNLPPVVNGFDNGIPYMIRILYWFLLEKQLLQKELVTTCVKKLR